MIKVYIPETEKQIDFLKSKGIKEEKFDYHPHIMKREINKFLKNSKSENIEIFTYNIVALDYIPEDIIYWVNRNNNILKFDELYGRDIFYNMTNDT